MLLQERAITWTKKRRILMNAFIASQFSYCPLVWMSHSRTMNNRINKIHEKTLRLVYKDEKKSLFRWFAEKDKSVCIYQRNLQMLATEMYKARNDLWKIFSTLYRKHTIWELIQLCKGEGTAQCTLEQKAYFPLLPKYGRSSLARLKMQKSLDIFKKKNKALDNR